MWFIVPNSSLITLLFEFESVKYGKLGTENGEEGF